MNESERRGRIAEEVFASDAFQSAMRERADEIFRQAREYVSGLRPPALATERRDQVGDVVYTITTLEETR